MAASINNIEHVVVLMFENRSFDHLFGAFPGANGVLADDGSIKPGLYNLDNPTQATGPSNPKHLPYPITPDVTLGQDLNHDFCSGMMSELFGPGTTGWESGQPIGAPSTDPEKNSSFYATKAWNFDGTGRTINGPQAMYFYEHGSLEVLHGLASEFVLCDNWFCDIPGDTLLNRYFMHTAQTDNSITDAQPPDAGIPCTTIFERIENAGGWKMYANQTQENGSYQLAQFDTRFLTNVRYSGNTNQPMTQFVEDLRQQNLPFYSFLMCWMADAPSSADTSMHPQSDIRAGENYLAAVYNALRSSSYYWDKTLLIVTFDENGGFYDHVPPPATVAPNDLPPASDTDQYLGVTCTFDFTLLGPRVPALLISPWLRSGVASGQYQNTSILRFLEEQASVASLTKRDANAPSLDSVFDEFGLAQPRADCPLTMPAYPGFPFADGNLSDIYVPPEDARPDPLLKAKLARIYGPA